MPAPTTTRSLFTGELSALTTLPSAGAPPPHSQPLLRDGRRSAAGSWSSRPVVTQGLATPEPGQRPPRSCPTRHVKQLQTRDLDRPASPASPERLSSSARDGCLGRSATSRRCAERRVAALSLGGTSGSAARFRWRACDGRERARFGNSPLVLAMPRNAVAVSRFRAPSRQRCVGDRAFSPREGHRGGAARAAAMPRPRCG